MAEGWRYLLIDSESMEPIEEFKNAKGRTLSLDNNKSGSIACTESIDSAVIALAKPWATAIAAQRDDDWLISGPVTSRVPDLGTGRVPVTALGWFELLLHRYLDEKVQYTAEDAGSMAFQLLDIANTKFDTGISPGISETTQPRDRTYVRDANIGQEIQSLAEIESGYDWYIDPRTKELNIVAHRGVDRPECKWLFIADGRDANYSNCKNVVVNEDGMNMVNDITARGKFASANASSLDSQTEFKVLMQERPNLSDVVDPNILNAYANGEIVYRENPNITFSIFPKAAVDTSVPRFGKDFGLGDTGYLTARRGYVNHNDQAIRHFGVDLSIDDNTGAETITRLQATAA